MEGELTPKQRLVYNKINLDSYKRFFEQSENFPFDTPKPKETVVEYYDFIIELIEMINISTEWDFIIRSKEIILTNIDPINDITIEKSESVISNLSQITLAVIDVIERRS
jgi:hypothetical protein